MPLSGTLKTIQWILMKIKLISWIYSINFNIPWSSQVLLFLDCSWAHDIWYDLWSCSHCMIWNFTCIHGVLATKYVCVLYDVVYKHTSVTLDQDHSKTSDIFLYCYLSYCLESLSLYQIPTFKLFRLNIYLFASLCLGLRHSQHFYMDLGDLNSMFDLCSQYFYPLIHLFRLLPCHTPFSARWNCKY